jgi:hypothetical protein
MNFNANTCSKYAVRCFGSTFGSSLGSPLGPTKERFMRLLIFPYLFLLVSACTPTVQVNAPKEPITINLNVKIEHEIRVKVDKELDELFAEDSNLF